jgi:predicted ATPase
MISYLSVEHYKSLTHVRLSLGPLNVFVGPNGSGKSNLIDSIMFVRDCIRYDIETAISQRFGIDSVRQWSRRSPFQIRLSLSLRTSSGQGRFALHLGSTKGRHRIVSETGSWRTLRRFRPAPARSPLARVPAEQVTYVRTAEKTTVYIRANNHLAHTNVDIDEESELLLSTIRTLPITVKADNLNASTYTIQQLWQALNDFERYSIFPNTLRTPQSISNDDRLSSNGDNITTVFKGLSKSKQGQNARSEILDGMKAIMPGLENIIIESAGGFLVPTFRVKEGNTAHDFNVSQISDGTLRVFGMLTALYQLDAPSVIAIEEPEQTIHPGALLVVADSIVAAAREKQLLVTTHSPYLLDRFGVDSLWAVQMTDSNTRIGPVSEDQKRAVTDNLFSASELMTIEGLRLENKSEYAR